MTIDAEDQTALANLEGLDKQSDDMTGWENAPSLGDLQEELKSAASDHADHVKTVRNYLDHLHMTGSAKLPKCANKSKVQPKHIRKMAEWQYSALSEPFLSTEDVFDVRPVSHLDKKAALQNGRVLNNQFNTKINKVTFIDDYVRTCVDEGTVIVRCGWESEEGEVEEEFPTFTLQPATSPEQMQEAQAMLQDKVFVTQNPEHAEALEQAMSASLQFGTPLLPVEVGTETRTVTKLIVNQPTLDICEFADLVIDPACGRNIEEAGFIIYRRETSLSELKRAGKYSNLDDIDVTSEGSVLAASDTIINDESKDYSHSFKDDARKRLVSHEYWGYYDIHDTGVAVAFTATWVGSTLIHMEESPYPDGGLPFVSVQLLPVRNSIYGEPNGVLIQDNQAIIGAVTRGMIDIMGKSAAGQVGSRKDALDLPNQRKFDAGLDYQYNPDVNPNEGFNVHTFPVIPNSVEFLLDQQNSDSESLTGVKAFSGGISGQALGTTATGIRSALDATAKRELGILRRLADGLKKCARKIVAMNGQFLSEVEVIRITDEEFEEIKRDDLAGNFDFYLNISTAESDNDKAEQLAFMLQTNGPSTDPEEVRMIRSEIARLRKMPVLAKRIEEFQPTPDPLEVKRQELEIELLQAQIKNELAKAHENEQNGELDAAKARTEEAKARDFNSTADQKDLDYIEQESGVHQERALETEGAKASHSQDSEILKAQLEASKPKPIGASS